MSVSLPSNKCIEIQQLAHALLLSQPILCAHGHAQLCQLCHVIQSDMLSLYQSPTHLFISFSPFSFIAASASEAEEEKIVRGQSLLQLRQPQKLMLQ